MEMNVSRESTARRDGGDRRANWLIGTGVMVLLGVGALHGQYIAGVRQNEIFYRWLVSVPNQARLFSDEFATEKPGPKSLADLNPDADAKTQFEQLRQNLMVDPVDAGTDAAPYSGDPTYDKDRELYSKLVQYTETVLPDIEAGSVENVSDDEPKLVRAVAAGGFEDTLWAIAKSPELAELRSDFFRYRRNNQLATLGMQFGLRDMYSEGTFVSLGNLFFGFRKMAANLVWLEVDKFFHQGMIHRMVPMMNTSVALDPNFVDAYRVGAWHLAYNVTAEMPPTPEPMKFYNERHDVWVGEKENYYYMGIDFLKDGIRKNYSNYGLYFDLGYTIYEEKLGDHKNAVHYLREATRHKHDVWVRSTLYRCLQYNGQYEEAIAGWEDYIKTFPDTRRSLVVAPRFIRLNTGLIFERDAEQALERAQKAEAEAKRLREEAAKATDSAEAQKLAQQAVEKDAEAEAERETYKSNLESAREVWNILREDEVAASGSYQGDADPDTFAKARLARLDALELVDQGRYLEAIVLLDDARMHNSEFFWEASDLIIDIKKKGNLPLYLTEQMAEVRKQEYEELQAKRAEEVKAIKALRSKKAE